MARQLVAALELAGHHVDIASELRGFTATPDPKARAAITQLAQVETDRMLSLPPGRRPQMWFTYHAYYKTPDQIGPAVAAAFGIPYVTAEASYSKRRDGLGWRENQRLVADAVRQAAVNLCFTERDRLGLEAAVPGGIYARLPPFIEPSRFSSPAAAAPCRLVTVAMMRAGDKLDSYRMLASALDLIRQRDWSLTIVGDGPERAEVEAMFAILPPQRVTWLGETSTERIALELSLGGIYVWPGCGEAYGLAYLEAQAAGLPVVAQSTAGVPEVVMAGKTGILTPEGDTGAFAGAIARLLDNPEQQRAMGSAARDFVFNERSLSAASMRLGAILQQHLGEHYER